MYEPLSAMWITPRGRKAVMDFRDGTNDWNTITAALPEDEYNLRAIQAEGIAWDIGCHIGSVAVALAYDNPQLRVIAVEPIEENCRIAWGNVWHNGLGDRVQIVCAAAGPPGLTETVLHWRFRGSDIAYHHAFIGTTEVGNSEVADSWRLSTDHDRVSIPVVDFARLVEIGGGLPSIIKIDCEGAEYGFLSAPEVAQVPLIFGEWHNVPFVGRKASTRPDVVALLPHHDVEFSGPEGGPGGFRAVRRA